MMKFFIVLGFLWIVWSGTSSLSIAAEKSGGPTDEPVEAPPEKGPEPAKGPLRRLESRLLGATPEERARLAEERKHLSAEAAAFGTDPTAIIGYYQLGYGHNAFTNGSRLDTATAVVRQPLTPNSVFQVTMPYVWADPNQPMGSTMDGTSDMKTRTGGRLYATENVALLISTDVSFPTATKKQLGTGKYTLGPGGTLAVPLPRARSLFYLRVHDYNSLGGDPSRPNLHFMQVESTVNTIWSERWWTVLEMDVFENWNQQGKTGGILQFEVGHR